MLIELRQDRIEYSRESKQGKAHSYFRNHTTAVLLCDCCGNKFERRARDMDPRRLTKDHTHVCLDCSPKKYAQRKGVESRRFWNITVDLDKDLDSI
jgi:hypothetical protein